MSQTIEQEILALEEQLLQAKRTLDIDAFQRLYSDNLMLTGVLGEPTCSKPAIIEEVTRGRAQRDTDDLRRWRHHRRRARPTGPHGDGSDDHPRRTDRLGSGRCECRSW